MVPHVAVCQIEKSHVQRIHYFKSFHDVVRQMRLNEMS